jgi:alpha-beta hydrolase superfamily lysophospholipase
MALPGITSIARKLLKYMAAGIVGFILASVVILVVYLNGRPDLSVWHLVDLDEEFTTESDVENFEQYLALEERLFRQLDDRVYSKVSSGPANAVNRYSKGSQSDPGQWPVNWNRTFELPQEQPRAGVLLLHGLSDSPYSLHELGEKLHQQGAMVLGLRIPGHGTAPSGLVETSWQDMAAAVRLAAHHVRASIGDKPLYIVGYSNGGALTMEYVLSALNDTSLPRVSGVVLLSPEIGVSGSAAYAIWQARLGHLFGFEKLAWNSLLPEYDPFKYGSFAVNAGDLAHRITIHIQKQLSALQDSGKLENLPPILAFQSGVDATVTASALVANLFAKLPAAGHELVLFDINRRVEMDILLKRDPRTVFNPLLENDNRSFNLTLVTNESNDSNRVVAYTTAAGDDAQSMTSKQLNEWPQSIYSLSHVALPISPTDPLYGGPDAGESPGIQLGNLALRGERGVLHVSGTDIMRLRWNPFFDYVETRILEFTQL